GHRLRRDVLASVPPDDVLEDVADVLGLVQRPHDRVDGARTDLVAPLHELDELVDHRPRARDAFVVALDRQPVPAQQDRAAAAVAGSASPPTVALKRSEATRVLAEIARIDRELSHTVDAYDGARAQLAALRGELRQNRVELARARRMLRRAQVRLERRLVVLYTSDQPTTLDILLGASSLSDLVDRLGAAKEVGAQDNEIARESASA